MDRPNPPAGRRHRHTAIRPRGLTLVELAVGLVLVAVIATLAVPAFSSMWARHRLKAAAQALAQDMSEARYEAARRGQALHVELQAGGAWCWTVATAPSCGCTAAPAPACRLKMKQASDYPGLQVAAAAQFRMEAAGTVQGPPVVQLHLENGPAVQLAMGPTGRAHLCSPEGALSGLPAC